MKIIKIFIFNLNIKFLFFKFIIIKGIFKFRLFNKIILENRCVSDCGNEYEFGDFFIMIV